MKTLLIVALSVSVSGCAHAMASAPPVPAVVPPAAAVTTSAAAVTARSLCQAPAPEDPAHREVCFDGRVAHALLSDREFAVITTSEAESRWRARSPRRGDPVPREPGPTAMSEGDCELARTMTASAQAATSPGDAMSLRYRAARLWGEHARLDEAVPLYLSVAESEGTADPDSLRIFATDLALDGINRRMSAAPQRAASCEALMANVLNRALEAHCATLGHEESCTRWRAIEGQLVARRNGAR